MANLFHRARMLWILEHRFDSWLWDEPTIQTRNASALNASKDIGMGLTDIAPTRESEPVMDAVHTAVVGSACS